MSADTVEPDYANPQTLNPYSYVLNNPIVYVDPDGHHPIIVPVLVIITVCVVAALVVDAIHNGEQNQGDIPVKTAHPLDHSLDKRSNTPKPVETLPFTIPLPPLPTITPTPKPYGPPAPHATKSPTSTSTKNPTTKKPPVIPSSTPHFGHYLD